MEILIVSLIALFCFFENDNKPTIYESITIGSTIQSQPKLKQIAHSESYMQQEQINHDIISIDGIWYVVTKEYEEQHRKDNALEFQSKEPEFIRMPDGSLIDQGI